jgi:hypothetical protein
MYLSFLFYISWLASLQYLSSFFNYFDFQAVQNIPLTLQEQHDKHLHFTRDKILDSHTAITPPAISPFLRASSAEA